MGGGGGLQRIRALPRMAVEACGYTEGEEGDDSSRTRGPFQGTPLQPRHQAAQPSFWGQGHPLRPPSVLKPLGPLRAGNTRRRHTSAAAARGGGVEAGKWEEEEEEGEEGWGGRGARTRVGPPAAESRPPSRRAPLLPLSLPSSSRLRRSRGARRSRTSPPPPPLSPLLPRSRRRRETPACRAPPRPSAPRALRPRRPVRRTRKRASAALPGWLGPVSSPSPALRRLPPLPPPLPPPLQAEAPSGGGEARDPERISLTPSTPPPTRPECEEKGLARPASCVRRNPAGPRAVWGLVRPSECVKREARCGPAEGERRGGAWSGPAGA